MFSWFCNHKWKILSEVKGENTLDRLKENGQSLGHTIINSNVLKGLTEKTIVTHLTCEKCGKLKVTTLTY